MSFARIALETRVCLSMGQPPQAYKLTVIELYSEGTVPKVRCRLCSSGDDKVGIYWIRGYGDREQHPDLPRELLSTVSEVASDPRLHVPESVLVRCNPQLAIPLLTMTVPLCPDPAIRGADHERAVCRTTRAKTKQAQRGKGKEEARSAKP